MSFRGRRPWESPGRVYRIAGFRSRLTRGCAPRNDEVALGWCFCMGLGGCRNLAGRVMTLPYRAEGKIFKNQLTIPKSLLKYSSYCNAIRKRSSPSHQERRRDSESLRWDTLRATFVRPERSGRALPIQSNEDAVTSAKQGGTARKRPCA